MAVAHVNLKCSDFLANVFSSFSQLKGSDTFTDVTLVSDDNMQIQAHKLILSVGSDFFREILSDKTHPHPMLCLDGVSSEDLQWIIRYLYIGEVSVPQSSLQKFLHVANKLKCYGLKEERHEETDVIKAEEKVVYDEVSISEDVQVTGEDEESLFTTFYEDAEGNTSKSDEEAKASGKDDRAFIKDYEGVEVLGNTFITGEEAQITGKDDEAILKTDLNESDEVSGNTSKPNLINEMSAVHTIEKLTSNPDFCRIEGKIFSMEQLKQFLKEMYKKEDGVFKCNYCNKSTYAATHMTEHSQRHVEHLEFECVCGKICQTTDGLRAHKNQSKKGSLCFQEKLDTRTNKYETGDSDSSSQYPFKKKVKNPSDFRNIILQIINTMRKSKRTFKMMGFTKNVIEPLVMANILKFNGSRTSDLADRWLRKIKMLRMEIKYCQEKFPGEEDKHLVSEKWGFGDLRDEISQGMREIEKLDKAHRNNQLLKIWQKSDVLGENIFK